MLGLRGAAEGSLALPRTGGDSPLVDETAPRSDASLPTDQEEAAPTAAPVTDAQRAREIQQARDGALIERALDGELEAFNEIVTIYQDYLFALAVRVVGDRDSAADAVQEAFFSCYRNLNRFRGDSFRSWLTRIALNAATDVLRQRKRRPAEPYPEWEDDAWQPPADAADNPERQAMRRDAAACSPSPCSRSPTTSARPSCFTTSRATTTRRSPT